VRFSHDLQRRFRPRQFRGEFLVFLAQLLVFRRFRAAPRPPGRLGVQGAYRAGVA
jgi:hypothetical protein